MIQTSPAAPDFRAQEVQRSSCFRVALPPRNGDAPHRSSTAQGVLEGREARALGRRATIAKLEAEAGIRPVGAEATQHLVEGESRERRNHLDPHCLEHGRDDALDELVDVLGTNERHLDVDLGEFGLPIRAQVFVTETAGELIVTLEAGDHQQLLEQLRGLRQRVEATCMDPAGNQVIPRTLRSGSGQDRGLDLGESVLIQYPPSGPGETVARAQTLLQPGLAQVHVAVGQAGFFVDFGLAVESERDGLGPIVDLEARGA